MSAPFRLARTGASVVALAVIASAVAVLPASAAPARSAAVSALPYLHVVTPPAGTPDATPYLADSAGRQVLLHGVAAVGMEDVAYPNANGGPALFPVSPSAYAGRCPKASALLPQPPLCEVQASKPAYQQSTAPGSGDDFAQMRALGFDVVRLVLNWSQLEPTPGHYSASYLNRVAQVVGWARQQGIYVILDMHQDQFSRYILPAKQSAAPSGCTPSGGSDGAPKWAVMDEGRPGCALEGIDELNPGEAAAFYNFWQNATPPGAAKGAAPGTGLQDHYIGALAALARRFEHTSGVLGYELMNEPQPGSNGSLPVVDTYQASSQELYPFYKRAIEALTGVRDGLSTCSPADPTSLTDTCAYPQLASVHHQQIFFEPFAYRHLTDFSMQASAPFSSYPDLVFAPHVYTYAFTIEQDLLGLPAKEGGFPPNFTFGYQTAESEAQAMGAAVFTTEFGDSSGTDSMILSNELAAQDATQTGGTLWAWKGLSARNNSCWCTRWQHSTYQTTSNGTPGKGNPHATPSPNDLVIASRQRLMARVWPRATAGRLGAYQYDPATRTFAMVASTTGPGRRGDLATDTAVFIPSTVHGAARVSGRAVLDRVTTAPDGSRVAYVTTKSAVPAGDQYWVTVGSASASQVRQVTDQAAHPLPPISEPQARAAVEAALNADAQSSDPTLRSNAQLVKSLAGVVLGPSDPEAPGQP